MTNPFDLPVTAYMTRAVTSVEPSADLDAILEILRSRRITSVPVVDPAGAPIGLVSRTDVIRIGTVQSGLPGSSPALPLPRRTAGDVMSTKPRTIPANRLLRYAAQEMVTHSIHRLMVVDDDGGLIGVISTLDLAAAVRDARIERPFSAWMTSPVVTLDARQPIAAAVDLLDRLHITAVVVVDAGWPIGMFSQVDALTTRDLPRETPVETALDTAMICLPPSLPIFRAAAHAAQLDVRRVIASDGGATAGILGGLDFARVVAG
jgi:CBS domain-containing protein